MKKNLLLLTLIAFVLFSCGSADSNSSDKDDQKEQVCNSETAIEYNDDMIDIQSDVDQAIVDLLDAIDTYDEEVMYEANEEMLQVIENARSDIEDMDDFDGSDDFKNAMVDLIDMYEAIVNEELSLVITYTINFSNLTDDEFDSYLEEYNYALNKYDDAFNDFTDFQLEFAEEWDFDLE